MAVFFFDSSAIVKRYVNEIGTGWVRTLMDPASANQAYLARLSIVEVTLIGDNYFTGSATIIDSPYLLKHVFSPKRPSLGAEGVCGEKTLPPGRDLRLLCSCRCRQK